MTKYLNFQENGIKQKLANLIQKNLAQNRRILNVTTLKLSLDNLYKNGGEKSGYLVLMVIMIPADGSNGIVDIGLVDDIRSSMKYK